jgi:hypothetical protein
MNSIGHDKTVSWNTSFTIRCHHLSLLIEEALARIEDARSAAADAWTVSRLRRIAKELEDTLAHAAPDPIALHRGTKRSPLLARLQKST